MYPDLDRAGAETEAPARSIFRSTSILPWALVALLALAFAVRTVGLDAQSLWRDEVDAIRFAGSSLPDRLAMFRQPGQNGPLYYLLLRPWLEVAGTSEFSLRYFSTLWGVLAVALTYRLGGRLFPGRRVPAIAALLAALSAYLVWYAQEGKMYSLVVLLALASTECYLAALWRGGAARWLGYVLFTTAAFYVHLVAAALVPAHALIFLAVPSQVRRARWPGWLVAMAAFTLPYVPLLAWQVPLLRAPAETGYSPVSPGDMVHSLLTSYSLGVLPPTSPWWLVPFIAALLAPVLWSKREHPSGEPAGTHWVPAGEPEYPSGEPEYPSGEGQPARRFSLLLLAAWLIVPVVIFGLVNLLRPMYTARYLIFVLPAFLLLIAAGIGALGRRARWLAALLLLIVITMNVRGLWLQARTPLKADFRAATRYVAERLRPGDLLLFQIPYARYSFEYYLAADRARRLAAAGAWAAGGPGSVAPGEGGRAFLPLVVRSVPLGWAEGLYTNAGMTPGEVDRLMAVQVAGYQAVWLVASEVPLWDERGLVEAWLADHGILTDRHDWVRVSVSRYTLP
ncbi:MAG: glycosyltransferase family 39 protein [Anaerolineae bacterium]|nr:glycosyltransferase family 39 protein [Anaerolineae bacterium]